MSPMSLSLPARPTLLWAVRILSFSAMSISLWLFSRGLTGDISSIAGCGGEGDCEEIMGGPWSKWFHIPVTLFAAAIHMGVLSLTLPSVQRALGRTGDQLLAAAGVILAGAAIYFLSILYIKLDKHCPWCLGLHLAGLAVAALILTATVRTERASRRGVLEAAMLTGFMAIGVLAAGQVWGPKPDSHLITSGGYAGESNAPAATAGSTAPAPAKPPAAPAPRMVSFFNDSLKYDAAALPILGAPDARVIMVEFFDYTCRSCRILSGDLKALKKKWPDTFGIIVLPTPLNRACNPLLRDSVEDHPGACELARISLALWRTKPSAFPVLHDYLLAIPLPVDAGKIAAARRKADELAGADAMTAALADPWVAGQLQENLGTFAKLTAQSIVMPKLLLHSSVMMHGPANSTEALIKVMEEQFNLPGAGSPVISKPR